MSNEKDTLGLALLVRRTPKTIDESFFKEERHRIIWRAMNAVEARGEELDLVTLTHQLQDTNELKEAGSVSYLIGLAEAVPTPNELKPPVKIHGDRVTVDELLTWLARTALQRGEDITAQLDAIRAWRDSRLN